MKNLKVQAFFNSPLNGELSHLDSIIEQKLFLTFPKQHGKKPLKTSDLSELKKNVSIPIEKVEIGGKKIYCCSDPIPDFVLSEWIEYQNKKIDTSHLALLIRKQDRKCMNYTSGAYKMVHNPLHIRLFNSVTWFVRGDLDKLKEILSEVKSMGENRSIGYGIISEWKFEEIQNDYSIFADFEDKKILMKTIPFIEDEKIAGCRVAYGAVDSPRWHPDNYIKVLKPC